MLEEGAAADIIVTDYDPTPLTADNINGHTLFGMSGRQTVTTVIDGKVRMQDRETVDIDEKEKSLRGGARACAGDVEPYQLKVKLTGYITGGSGCGLSQAQMG